MPTNVHARDNYIQMDMPDGTQLATRCSHVEDSGQHTFVITTDEANFEKIQRASEKISEHLLEKHDLKSDPSRLTYVERHPETEQLYEVGHTRIRYDGTKSHERHTVVEVDASKVNQGLKGEPLPRTEGELAAAARADLSRAATDEAKKEMGQLRTPQLQKPWTPDATKEHTQSIS